STGAPVWPWIGGMARARREWPALDPLVFAGAFAAYAIGLPLGLARAGAGAAVAGGFAFAAPGPLAPLPRLLARVVAFVPVGDLATRAGLAAALAAALAATALARLACDLLVTM